MLLTIAFHGKHFRDNEWVQFKVIKVENKSNLLLFINMLFPLDDVNTG